MNLIFVKSYAHIKMFAGIPPVEAILSGTGLEYSVAYKSIKLP